MYRSAEENRRKRARQGNIADVDFQTTRDGKETCASITGQQQGLSRSSTANIYSQTTYQQSWSQLLATKCRQQAKHLATQNCKILVVRGLGQIAKRSELTIALTFLEDVNHPFILRSQVV